MKRYSTLISSFVVMSAIGGLYAWSMFVLPLKKEVGVSVGFTQLIFGVIIGVLPVAMVIGGKLMEYKGAKFISVLSGVLFSAGYIVVVFFHASLLSLLLGIGVLSGVGTGFGYIASLSAPVKWFPDRRGLIIGISTAGFGAGAIFLSFLVKYLLSYGYAVIKIFAFIGFVYGLLIILFSFMLFEPRNISLGKKYLTYNNKVKGYGFLKSKIFWALFIGMFAGSFAGLLLIGNLKPAAVFFGISESAAVLSVSSLSVGNTIGRVFWGHIMDAIGIKKSICLSLLALSLFLALTCFVGYSNVVFVVLSFFIGMAFGANFVLYAASAGRIFGIEHISRVYPILSFSYGIAGLTGPPAGGYAYDFTGSYVLPIFMASLIALIGTIAVTFMLKDMKRA